MQGLLRVDPLLSKLVVDGLELPDDLQGHLGARVLVDIVLQHQGALLVVLQQHRILGQPGEVELSRHLRDAVQCVLGLN